MGRGVGRGFADWLAAGSVGWLVDWRRQTEKLPIAFLFGRLFDDARTRRLEGVAPVAVVVLSLFTRFLVWSVRAWGDGWMMDEWNHSCITGSPARGNKWAAYDSYLRYGFATVQCGGVWLRWDDMMRCLRIAQVEDDFEDSNMDGLNIQHNKCAVSHLRTLEDDCRILSYRWDTLSVPTDIRLCPRWVESWAEVIARRDWIGSGGASSSHLRIQHRGNI
jgi:hypothetical protein